MRALRTIAAHADLLLRQCARAHARIMRESRRHKGFVTLVMCLRDVRFLRYDEYVQLEEGVKFEKYTVLRALNNQLNNKLFG